MLHDFHLQIITSGGVTYKNEPWHRECFTCTNCDTSLAGQRFTSRDEKPYCAECFGELFAKRCTSCSKPITGKKKTSSFIFFCNNFSLLLAGVAGADTVSNGCEKRKS